MGESPANKSMLPRRSLALPLGLGITMIFLLIVLIIGWILVTVWGATKEGGSSIYWVWMVLGTVILCGVLTGVAFYLAFIVNSIRVNRRQANFIDAVTHELKSPIASLRLGLETLSRRKLSHEDMDRFTGAMKNDVLRLDRLISHLLDAAGLNVVSDEAKCEVFDLRGVIRECISDVCTYQQFDEAHVSVSDDPVIHYGPIQDFEIIFRNLIDNAVKYSGTPPRIDISLGVKGNGNAENSRVNVAIENNGSSVPENEKQRVFQRFERTGIELERTKPGVGLGLFIVRMLLRRNKGTVRIETPTTGDGTRVVVEFPVHTLSPTEDPKGVALEKEMKEEDLVGKESIESNVAEEQPIEP